MLNLDFRPRKLSEVIGQDDIVLRVKNRSKNFNFPEVMFFQGSTGTGKTTVAYIVASLLNCKDPVKQEDGSYEPCGECPACKDIITETFSRDVIFKDGSDMDKQDVLNLATELDRSPMQDYNKIVIIEEAQQLASAGAKGALLKILEKARKNVHIILLTMDINKFNKDIKKAITDRCQVYKFSYLSSDWIIARLSKIVAVIDPNENFPDSIVELCKAISKNAGGSLRKAIEDLDNCIYSNIFTEKEYIKAYGIIDENTMYTLLDMYLFGNKEFFTAIKNYNYYDFFLYSRTTFLNMQVERIIGTVGDSYAYQRSLKYWKTGFIDKLLELYISLPVKYPTDEYMIRYYLTKFFYDNIMEKPSSRRIMVKE